MYKHKIEYLIRSLGIGATYRGYRYLSFGIELCLKDEDYLLAISKLLYPRIAKEFQTTSVSVERDIRTVIKVCWERGGRSQLQHIALHSILCRPTASEFFDILVAYLHRTEREDHMEDVI